MKLIRRCSPCMVANIDMWQHAWLYTVLFVVLEIVDKAAQTTYIDILRASPPKLTKLVNLQSYLSHVDQHAMRLQNLCIEHAGSLWLSSTNCIQYIYFQLSFGTSAERLHRPECPKHMFWRRVIVDMPHVNLGDPSGSALHQAH